MKKLFTCVLTALLSITLFVGTAVAFDGNDYNYGGDGDGGYDYNGGYNYNYSGSGGGTLDISPGTVIVVIVIVILVASVSVKSSHKGGKTTSTASPNVVRGTQGINIILPDRTAQITEIIKKHDSNFSPDDFVTFAKQVYIDIQTAWCNRDMSPVRPVMHENLYNMTCRQVQSKIDQGVVYHYESIAINTAYLTSYALDNNFEYATIYLNSRMIDYQVDEKTGNVIKGDKSTRWDMRYKMKFVRTNGIMSKEATDSAKGHNCPNCGAPLEITSSGKCSYCDSVVTTGEYSWVLTDFTTVRNDTKDDGIRGVNG